MNQRRRLQGSAAVACAACRRLKMRCVGADDPPCHRCVKAKRNCIVSHQRDDLGPHTPTRSIHPEIEAINTAPAIETTQSEQTLHTTNIDADRVASPNDHNVMQTTQCSPGNSSLINLPSIYSVVPVEMISRNQPAEDRASQNPSLNSVASATRRRPVPRSPTDEELVQLLHFFKLKVVHNVPIVTPDDLYDAVGLIQSRSSLAICIAFVTARLVPGCRWIQAALLPEIKDILARKHNIMSAGRDATWSLLQGMGVLFLYATPHHSEAVDHDWTLQGELTLWALKSSLETLAFRLGLYRSYDEVIEVQMNAPNNHNIVNSLAVRQYLFWLWMFNVAHHYAMLTRTPPTIQLDTAIKSGPELLRGFENIQHVRKILLEVELYEIWARLGRDHPAMGEWWCPPRAEVDLASATAILRALNESVDRWCDKWRLTEAILDPTMTPSRHNDATVDFLSRYIRFHTSTFLTRCIQIPSDHESDGNLLPAPSSDRSESLQNTRALLSNLIQTASICSTFYAGLDPLAKDTTRYITPFGFAMVSFSCYFVIMAAELLWDSDIDVQAYLSKVSEAAEFMSEIALHEDDAPQTYAAKIFARLEKLQSTESQNQLNHLQAPARTSGTNFRNFDLEPRQLNQFNMEGLDRAPLHHDIFDIDIDAFWRENCEDLIRADPSWVLGNTH